MNDISAGTRVLVTGAAGFVGSNVCQRLRSMGIEVHGSSRRTRGRENGVIWWQADLADDASTRNLFSRARPDIVIHLAGGTDAGTERDRVLPTFHSLATSTVNVLKQSTEFGCRRVLLADSVSGPPLTERLVTPTSPYAAAKWVSSTYGKMFRALYGTPVVTLRPSMIYGPGQDTEKLCPHVILSLMRGIAPRITNDPFRADWVFIDDVADAFVLALSKEGIDGETFDLGTGSAISTPVFALKIAEIMGSSTVPKLCDAQKRIKNDETNFDIDTTLQKLSWRAATSLDVGLRRTIDWYHAECPVLAQRSDIQVVRSAQ